MFVKNGQTDVTTYFVLRDSTNHAPSLSVSLTDIDLYYVEDGAAISSKADASALAAADSAHADNSAYHVGRGLYRIDWPDAAFDGGIGKKVYLVVTTSGTDDTFLDVELTPAVDVVALSQDATAADNLEAAADGTGYNLGNGAIVAASVSGAVGSVTGAVGSVTGNVGGNVTGSVGSVTGAVGSVTADVGITQAGADKVWGSATRTLTSFGTLAADVATAVWAAGTRTLTSFGTLVADIWAYATRTLSAFAFTVTTSDSADITAIKAKTDNLPASPAAVGSAMTLTTGERDSIAAALLDLTNGVETNLTVRQSLQLASAALAGILSGAATAEVTIKAARNSGTTRITATVDADGNRSAITYNL